MMARFGFLGMPFYEGVDDEDVINEIDEKVFEYVSESMKYYYKNPNKLKTGYRNIQNKKLNEVPSNINEYVKNISDGVLDVVENYLRKAFDKKKISESTVVEDKVISDKSEDETNGTSVDGSNGTDGISSGGILMNDGGGGGGSLGMGEAVVPRSFYLEMAAAEEVLVIVIQLQLVEMVLL